MTDEVILTELNDKGVATVIFNRPEVSNAYNGEMIEALEHSIETFANDSRVRVIVLRGNGPHFQAGADLKWITKVSSLSKEDNIRISQNTIDAVRGLNQCPKPTVAMVHGACFGGGTGIIASCDIVVASSNAIFSIAEVRWGLHAGPILPQLSAAIGTRQLRKLALTGEKFDAFEAKRLGLVHEVCDNNHLEDISSEIIQKILKNGPQALKDTKRIIFETSDLSLDNEIANKLAVEHAKKRQSSEAAEGLMSFKEKREAAWEG